MRIHGKITHWNRQKAYGFITPASGENVFVHIRAFMKKGHQPEIDQRVTFFMSTDKQGRPCAARVELLGDKSSSRFQLKGNHLPIVFALVFLGIVAGSVLLGALPLAVLLVYLGASALTFIIYAWDKNSAKRGAWRTQESTLHLFALVGGWPGALVAQQVLRHKSKKEEFRFVFWLTVIVNLAAFCWLYTDTGSGILNSFLS